MLINFGGGGLANPRGRGGVHPPERGAVAAPGLVAGAPPGAVPLPPSRAAGAPPEAVPLSPSRAAGAPPVAEDPPDPSARARGVVPLGLFLLQPPATSTGTLAHSNPMSTARGARGVHR